MSFLHGAILFGLFALAIPIIVHLLNRRQFEVVDWAAMQFLQISRKTRQRALIEHVLLLLLRMGLIAALVLAVAMPVLKLSCVAKLPAGDRLAAMLGQSNRDIVLIVDGSASMDYQWQGRTAHQAAQSWAADFVKDLHNGDRLAIVQAKQQPIAVLGSLTLDRQEVLRRLDAMPRPRGGVDWAKAVQEATRILEPGRNQQKEIIILTDGQRQGWANAQALEAWQLLTFGFVKGADLPRIWVVNVVPDRPDQPPNWSVSPIRSNRALATVGREVQFQFDVQAQHNSLQDGSKAPDRVDYLVDGEPVGAKAIPTTDAPMISLDFKRAFSSTGSHLVSVMIGDDAMPNDNRRDYAIDVLPAIPVLIVDGDPPGASATRPSDFLRYAIAPPQHPQPSFLVRTIAAPEFASQVLTSPLSREAWTTPRVLVLQNVTSLSEAQHQAVEGFTRRGGGVFVLLGPNCDFSSWNKFGYQNGKGWLPTQMLTSAGDDDPKKAAMPVADGLDKTFLDLFKDANAESFLKSSFHRWWKLDAKLGVVIAKLNTGDPLVVERSLDRGRVLVAAVPFDDSWRTDLLRSHDFVRLCHECMYHLASARTNDVNVQPGQSIVFRPMDGEPPSGVTVTLPDGRQLRVEAATWPIVFDDTRETGVYKVATDAGRVQYYVVQSDNAESRLAGCSDVERKLVLSLFADGRFRYESERANILQAIGDDQNDLDLGWMFLLLVIGLLTAELAFTRSLVRKLPPVTE